VDEAVSFGARNLQVDLHRRRDFRIATTGRLDLYTGLTLVHRGPDAAQPAAEVFDHTSADGRLTVTSKPDREYQSQTVIDEATGMQLKRSLHFPSDRPGGQYLWQFAPREYAEGLWLPQVRVEMKVL